LFARFKIPAAARALNEYFSGTSSITKMSDNEHTTASLGDSEVLSVKHSEREPIPKFSQRREDGAQIPSSVR
jgi:hypothetical protein